MEEYRYNELNHSIHMYYSIFALKTKFICDLSNTKSV